jgi:hypothetical protein
MYRFIFLKFIVSNEIPWKTKKTLKIMLILILSFINTVKLVSRLILYFAHKTSVAEPHHFYAAPAPGKNFDAAPAAPAVPAPAPTLLYSKAKFLN